MKRITLAMFGCVIAGSVRAQDPVRTPPPPEPRARAVAPARPAATPEPRIAPVSPVWSDDELRAVEMSTRIAIEHNRAAAEVARMEADRQRDFARLNIEMEREQARTAVEAARAFAVDAVLSPMTPMAPMAPLAPMALSVASAFGGDRFDRRLPPQAWAQGDPADSLYKVAREMLNRGDWGRAARTFADLQKNYPKSAYQSDAQYWEAYSRYKIGTTEELRTAAKILEPITSRITPQGSSSDDRTSFTARAASQSSRRTSDSEILALYARVNGALAQRGDSEAAAKIAKAASTSGSTCDQEDIQIRTEALNALSQMDPAQALPLLRRVLDRKDDCSAQLRRNAVFILGRRNDADASATLIGVAKSDPNQTVRLEAINYLSRIPGDAGLNALEELLRTEQDERVQRAVVRSLMASDSPRARTAMRTLIERRESPLNLRIEAVNSISGDRASTEDAAYLRSLFGKADNDQMKNAILSAVARIGGAENDQWVISIARNANESSSVRANALQRLSRSPTLTTADLSKLYDASSESYEIRNRIINMLGNRKDPEATDKLIEIVRTSTVVQNRTQAIVALRDKKDPRATQALMDILDGKRP
jgi:HEAT repeat protein/TolA-binding protein